MVQFVTGMKKRQKMHHDSRDHSGFANPLSGAANSTSEFELGKELDEAEAFKLEEAAQPKVTSDGFKVPSSQAMVRK